MLNRRQRPEAGEADRVERNSGEFRNTPRCGEIGKRIPPLVLSK